MRADRSLPLLIMYKNTFNFDFSCDQREWVHENRFENCVKKHADFYKLFHYIIEKSIYVNVRIAKLT